MKSFDETDFLNPQAETTDRLGWIPLVLGDMADYASDKGESGVAVEIEKCRQVVAALLDLSGTRSGGPRLS